MTNFNGQFSAGRDMNIANRDIHFHESRDTYKSHEQMLPEELRAEEPERRRRLKDYTRARRTKAPKWLILPLIGFVLGVYFVEYVQQFTGNNINIFSLFEVLMYFVKQHPPYLIAPAMVGYVFILWVLPFQMIFGLLLGEDEVMRRHRKALRDIALLLAEKG